MPASLREPEGGPAAMPVVRRTWHVNPVSCLSVTVRSGRRIRTRAGTRTRGVLGAAALAAVTALAVAGCVPAAPASTVAGAERGLTLAEAEAAYGAYITSSDQAAMQGNEARALADLSDIQWAVVRGQYTALANAGTPVPRYRYGRPVFYVPAETRYPQWFMVAVPRSTVSGGQAGAAVRTLMVFERDGPAQPWTLDGAATLNQPLPPIARGAGGYAVGVRTTDPGLLLQPDVVGATQAAVVDEGPASAAAAVIGSGPLTTGLYAAQNAQASADGARGLQYQWLLEGGDFSQFELKTAGGGALVLYGMELETTTSHDGLAAGPPIPIPAQVSPLLAAPTEIGYHAVFADWTYQYAALDPPGTARGAKVEIIGVGGGPTYGHAY